MLDITIQSVKELLEQGLPAGEIAKQVFPNVNYLTALEKVNTIKESFTVSRVTTTLKSKLDYAREALEREIGEFREVKPPNPSNSPEQVIVVVGDLHIPWHNEKTLAKIMNLKADRIVVNGDVMDCFAASRFVKEYNNVHIQDEIVQARVILEAFAERFSRVDVITGNHDARFRKAIQKEVPYLMNVLPKTVIEIIAKDIPNVFSVGNIIENTCSTIPNTESTSDHWVAIGDAIIGHWEYYSQVNGKSAEKAYDWIMKWKAFFGLEITPKVVIQAHTHRFSRLELPNMTTVYEGGCVCKPQQYQLRPNSYGVPPQNGYIVLTQTDGVTTNSYYERIS